MTPMMVLAGVLIALALIALTGILVGVLIVRAIYKRIRRNRALNHAVLRTRTAFTWGPQQQVLKLRMRLNDALDSGRAAVDIALRGSGPRGELVRLFRRIQAEGSTLDTQLRLMESETDTAVLAAEVPTARDRVEQMEGIVRRLRTAVSSGLGELSDDALVALRADVDREVAALHAGVQELHTLNAYDGLPQPRRQPSTNRLYGGNES
ncbi:hypothetical protein GCM10009617_11980 [Leifsonia poae]|uniref:Secreted protein n=2 Tax=Leifsonia poae TaxID=110933 RepID=A0A9W6M0G4_9MICO|nr:hypothetical protein GCM10017584_24200 [Leifsonia poae]